MPTHQRSNNNTHLKLALKKWTKHFEDAGCSHKKVYLLARKHALRELRGEAA